MYVKLPGMCDGMCDGYLSSLCHSPVVFLKSSQYFHKSLLILLVHSSYMVRLDLNATIRLTTKQTLDC